MVARLSVAALVLALLAPAPAGARGRGRPGPRRAAKQLIARLRPGRDCNFAASRVASRRGRLWLALGSSCDGVHVRVRVFRWSGGAWRLDGTVTGPLTLPVSLYAASLTGADAPDFAVEGCGAGDTVCLSVVSKRGGHWHAVPFEYAYGRSVYVDGTVEGNRVAIVFDACGCAGGPTTVTYERYARGVFVPTFGPGRAPSCSAAALEWIADGWQERVLRFKRVGCAGGWALAVGDGAGFTGPVVALFELSGFKRRTWHLLTLDDGDALPAAPAIYALPLGLLTRLAAPAGAILAPQVAAARLIARLQKQYDFEWPLQNGIVEAGGQRWLIAVVPVGPAKNDYSPPPVGALIYRWDGTAWAQDGQVPHLSHHLNVTYDGGWFESVPAPPPAVAFELVQSCCTKNATERAHSTGVITNAGGSWQVAALPGSG